LLKADLTAFGYSGTGATAAFKFTGTVTGGTYAAPFGGIGSPIGVIVETWGSTFTGAFTANFANTSSVSTVDVRVIPEPCTLTVLALGGLALLRRRRSVRF
jgi:hypothetical protein